MIVDYPEKIKLLMQLYYSQLSEKDRRRYAAVEAIKLGWGGTSYISKVLGVDRNTIMEGKKELLALPENEQTPLSGQRRPGGGRKKNGKISRH